MTNGENQRLIYSPRPFLKWAGGKRALLEEIRNRTPEYAGKYIEPFLGAGAVLFDQDFYRKKVVSDFNSDLIEVYETIRDKPNELLAALRKHKNSKEHYYEVRAWDREKTYYSRKTKVQRAARFIFLNKTNYNGLYRVNAAGQMNVPFGTQANPDWIQKDLILSVSTFLNARADSGEFLNTFMSGDYKEALKIAKPGDWVYLDPPYADTFTHYQSGGFSDQQQAELRNEILRLTELKIPVLLSNSNAPIIRELYSDKSMFNIELVTVRRAIGSASESRVKTQEVLINNYKKIGAAVG